MHIEIARPVLQGGFSGGKYVDNSLQRTGSKMAHNGFNFRYPSVIDRNFYIGERIMRNSIFALLLGFFSLSIFAQENKLPDVLRPDPASIALAESSGTEVFKLLPRMPREKASYKDEDDPIGIRGGGAYYSFTTRLHSYNKIPQISLDRGDLYVGFYGPNYGFFHDLGAVSLEGVSLEAGTPKFLIDHTPPTLYDEVLVEAKKAYKDGAFTRRIKAVSGHVYLLRAISVNEADILVAFRVEQIGDDGSATIRWKRIKDLGTPKMLYQSDESLRAKVDEVLKDPRFNEVSAVVKDDHVLLTGSTADGDFAALLNAVQKTGVRGVDNRVVRRRP